MVNQSYAQVIDNLASAIEIPTSKLTVLGPDRRHATTLDYTHINIFLYKGLKVAEIFVNSGLEDRLIYARLLLPYQENSSELYTPFTLDSLAGFRLESVRIDYHIDKHPRFKKLLENLRLTKRIPKEKLHGYLEPNIHDYGEWGLYGFMEYIFGHPRNNKRLCIQVDPIKGLEEFVPEAEKQKNQGHYCIHGETAPFIPFNPYRFTNIDIVLRCDSDIEGHSYLNEFLDGLIVPSDGLSIKGSYGNEIGMINTRTPYNPTTRHSEIIIYNPERSDNWRNLIALARKIEEMFRA